MDILYLARMSFVLGVILMGLSLFMAASLQVRIGETTGLMGQGKILRAEKPAEFTRLFWTRIVLGLIVFVAGIILLFVFV